jgi:hypothetical protein
MAPISMPTGGPKMIVPLVAAVTVVGVGAVFLGQSQQLQEVKQRLAVMQQDAAKQRAENESLTQQLTGLQTERKTLEERLASVRTQLASATGDLERSRTSLADLTSRYEQLTAERSQLQVRVATTTSERDEARMKSLRLEQRNDETTRALSRMRERFALLNRDYKEASDKLAKLESAPPPSIDIIGTIGSPEGSADPTFTASTAASSAPAGSVELPPIVVRTDGGTGSSRAVRGRLLEVNRAHNFVVVDKGSQDGVRVGMEFDILRGASSVGRATVVRVRPKLSACDIVRSKTPGQLQIGDTAVQGGLSRP